MPSTGVSDLTGISPDVLVRHHVHVRVCPRTELGMLPKMHSERRECLSTNDVDLIMSVRTSQSPLSL